MTNPKQHQQNPTANHHPINHHQLQHHQPSLKNHPQWEQGQQQQVPTTNHQNHQNRPLNHPKQQQPHRIPAVAPVMAMRLVTTMHY